MLEALKQAVFEANLELVKQNLIKYTWGNVSGFSPEDGLFVIKPSGVDYDTMRPEDMVVCDLDGNVVEGSLNPSSDTPTHAYLYKHVKGLKAIVHTHSPWATTWAQSGLDVPVFGTTHADTFYGPIPCARFLSKAEIDAGYEWMTGKVIVETFEQRHIDFAAVPAILLQGHGPFAWGDSPAKAVVNAVVLEEVCRMNFYTRQLNPMAPTLPQTILDKHYLRKHGKDAYYGQSDKEKQS